MVHKTVLKVDISCQKNKKKLLKAVSALQGVDKIEVDAGKGTLTVTGTADPYEVIVRTREAAKFAEVVSVGPPSAPPKQDGQKKPDEKKPNEKKPDLKAQIHMPDTCLVCQRMAVAHVERWDEPDTSCSIL